MRDYTYWYYYKDQYGLLMDDFVIIRSDPMTAMAEGMKKAKDFCDHSEVRKFIGSYEKPSKGKC